MDQNIWQILCMFGTLWYMNAQEKYTLQREKYDHILVVSQLKKYTEQILKDYLKIFLLFSF